MITSIEQITDELLRNGLLDDESLAESCHALEKQGHAITGPHLLAFLTSEGKLTPFQADEVGAGRGNQLLLGNYLVLSKIGEGGMGTVFKALHRRMQRLVAVKVIRKEVATREFITRFRREIQLLARLNHPNVVIAYDSDQCPMGDFLVMEYVEGTDLSEVMKRTGPLSIAEAISAVRQSALALDYAHQQGIVHRDIKPANLLRDVNGCIKVVDLGLARVAAWEGATASDMTQMGAVAGTVDFMSPEQAENPLGVDHRSDIYSLGCTLFYLLTSGPMFAKSSPIGRILAHRSEPPPKLPVARSDVPDGLDAIFQRMVAKSPHDRFDTMQQVVVALDAMGRPPATTTPVASDHTQIVSIEMLEEIAQLERMSVVIVEESRLQVSMIRKMLGEFGVTDVTVCPSGQETLTRLSTTSAKVLLSSMSLPDMSGLELAARIRDSLRIMDMGIVLMSGDRWTSARQAAARRMGRLQLLGKPFAANDLRAAIQKSLKGDDHVQRMDGLDTLRVLIVDDSPVARRHEQKTLTELGFTNFTLADDGVGAVEQLMQSKFDLVVTDYHMPQMDGFQLISHIRQESSQRTIPIVMVTTEFDPQKLAGIYQLGVSAICNKSFDRELVRNIVIQLFA